MIFFIFGISNHVLASKFFSIYFFPISYFDIGFLKKLGIMVFSILLYTELSRSDKLTYWFDKLT